MRELERAAHAWAKQKGIARKDIHCVRSWSDLDVSPTEDTQLIISTHPMYSPSEGWQTIFRTAFCSLYEKETRLIERPLRSGVSKEFLEEILGIVRSVAMTECGGGQQEESFERKLASFASHDIAHELCDLDVAVWVDGHLRGSIVASNKTLAEGMVDAARSAVRDPRFKPLHIDEIPRARFEITLIPDVWMPLGKVDLDMDRPYAEMAYKVVHAGNVRGWYMPTIFNIRSFSSMRECVYSLVFEKAKLTEKEAFSSHVRIAPAFVCVEGEDNSIEGEDLTHFYTTLKAHTFSNIDESGYSSPILFSDRFTSPRIDIVRLAFLYRALAEVAPHEPQVQKLKQCIDTTPQTSSLAQIYVEQGNALLKQSSQNVIDLHPLSEDTFLVHVQHSVLKELRDECPERAIETLFGFWKERKEYFSLALAADLPRLLSRSGHQDGYMEMYKWYHSLQDEDGSFPNVPGSNFVYTRGTGKIVEAFGDIPDAKDMVKHALTWLAGMQYTKGNMYHIPNSLKGSFSGGLRHDPWNRDIWIDSNAHALLALHRFLRE